MYNLSKYISKARCYAGFCYFMHSCLSAYETILYTSVKSCLVIFAILGCSFTEQEQPFTLKMLYSSMQHGL